MTTLYDAFSLCMLMTWTVALAVLISYGTLNLMMRSVMALPRAQTGRAPARDAEAPAVAHGAVPALSTSSQLAA